MSWGLIRPYSTRQEVRDRARPSDRRPLARRTPARRSSGRPGRIAASRAGSATAPLSAAASAAGSPGGTSHPLTPGRTLSGSPPAVDATTARLCAIASSVTRELPSYSVGCTKSVASLVPGVHLGIGDAPEEASRDPRRERRRKRFEAAAGMDRPRADPSPAPLSRPPWSRPPPAPAAGREIPCSPPAGRR